MSGTLLIEAPARVGEVRRQQRLPPGAVLEVPFHGGIETRFERVLGQPPEFSGQFAEIDRITEIMSRPIGYKAY